MQIPFIETINSFVSSIGDWLSLFSFVISIYTANTVTNVKRATVGRAMMPALVEALKESSKLIAAQMRDFEENKDDFELELARCIVSLRAVRKNTKGEAARRASVVEALASKFNRKLWFKRDADVGTVKQARMIYVELSALVVELDRTANEQLLGG